MGLGDAFSVTPGQRGGGLAGALAQGAQGALLGQDQRREMDWQDQQRAQIRNAWDRDAQERQIMDTVTPGATDEERLDNLITAAEGMNRGDLVDKLRKSKEALAEKNRLEGTANGARAIIVGQYDKAAEILNKSGIWGKINRISPALDPTGRKIDDRIVVEYPDPTTGENVSQEIPLDFVAAAAQNPKDVLTAIQNHQKNTSLDEYRDKQAQTNQKRADDLNRHYMAQEKVAEARVKILNAKGGGPQRLLDFDKKMAIARKVYANEADAFEYVMNPTKNNQDLNRWQKEVGWVATLLSTPEEISNAKGALPQPKPPVRRTPETLPARKQLRNKATGAVEWFKLVNGRYVKE